MQYICRICRGLCDPGELEGGICLECLDEEQQRQIGESTAVRILNSPSYQMETELEEMGNGR